MARIIEMIANRIIDCDNPTCNKLAVVWHRDISFKEDKPLCREHVNQLIGIENTESCWKCLGENLTLLRESEWKKQFHCQDCLTIFTIQKEDESIE